MDQFLHALGVVVEATTVVLLPDRIDVGALILQVTGLFALMATALRLFERRIPRGVQRYLRLEYLTVGGACTALLILWAIWLKNQLS